MSVAVVASRVASLLVILIASAAIVSTYDVFSQTYDEPGHIAAGMEWWQLGRYTFEEQHPPLARAAVALGPYLSGLRLARRGSMWEEGNAILYAGGRYERNLAVARAGILPFFLLACAIVWMWARSLAGEGAALLSLFFFASTWPVLGHAGLATTDMAVTGTLAASLFAYQRWLEHPSVGRSVILGLAGAAAMLSKLSALPFFPVAAFVLTATWWLSRSVPDASRERDARRASHPRGLGVAAWVTVLTVWAGYRFSVKWLGDMPLPAPELIAGVYQVLQHSTVGHASYLLGERSMTGWWYYFPVVLLLKTPVPLLALALLGGVLPFLTRARSDAWRLAAPVLSAMAILLTVLPSTINTGVRYLLPIFPLLALSAGLAATAAWHWPRREVIRWAVAVMVLWQLVGVVRAHPDHLAAFNELAGREPERLVDDSNVDWGQDLLRLARAIESRDLKRVHVAYYGTADPAQHLGASYLRLAPEERVTGWVAVSERYLVGIVDGRIDDGYLWLRKYKETAQIGRSIRLIQIVSPSD